MRRLLRCRAAHHPVILLLLILSSVSMKAVTYASDPLIIDADSQFGYAQSRLDAGAYDEAIYEFNRFIHFFPTDERIARARYQIGMAHFQAGQYHAAAAIFNALTADMVAPPLVYEAFFMLSHTHARLNMSEQAQLDLHNLIALAPPAAIIDRARYELGWLNVDQGRWNLAQQSFNAITPANQAHYQVGDLYEAIGRWEAIPMKHPTTAGLLSIIPGGGQLYCGRYQDALTAFLINAGLILAAWESFDNDLIALGGVIGFVEFGFYTANIYGAVSSAHKYNRDRFDAFREDLHRKRQSPLTLAPTPAGIALCARFTF